ncbi:hypothetical protein HBI56_039920 [Parastagonospora nodorum]|uniref:SnoaL-like domain-containing protein n=2 Tax=Phaeosphaeria nodorum (strain SN15 / ATCC MYA-4574 / FGSC 10173) TaxID=321614 RepID=A0A7U2HWW5_PHANO|nr:hypothetical protein SNOG_03611 [Parastagonospora nodorum SN15]KAH3915941.1 hypothetical protein HBH56_066850 [Parastagonospora nodorum]EAT88816.2 hypothetical protein SNOG_03611 [Parastagonospora nodorum SN15]KAH3932241.1 hypothetical protein HBH54_081240 [Parastagonospora nodorum]KAH3955102.1 hypothetical protein HBH53_013140 [Parastagonospora nodorum]KAH3986533.1 hypothetical protein HBH52_044340 [Parastagonospora nodorum]
MSDNNTIDLELHQNTMTGPSALDHLAISNVLSCYCEALDTKNFELLEEVFVNDVVADYPFNSNLEGVGSVSEAIRNRLGPIRTHHSLTTQSVVFRGDGKGATAATHFVGVHFGQGPHEGKMLSAYGRYLDELVLLPATEGNLEGVPGASGIWRIKKRKVVFTQRIGDESIMKEF